MAQKLDNQLYNNIGYYQFKPIFHRFPSTEDLLQNCQICHLFKIRDAINKLIVPICINFISIFHNIVVAKKYDSSGYSL